MADCSRCGADNRPGARFCGVCGNPMDARPAGKAVAPPVIVAPAPTTADSSTRPGWLVPAVLAALAILIGGAVGLSLAGSGENGAADAGTDDATASSTGDDDTGDDRSEPAVDESEADVPETEPPETVEPLGEPAVRTGYLYSNFAKLRTGPNIGNPEITTLTREGAPLQIIGRQQNGWYDVRMDGSRGWIFGAFVTPPPSGFRILQSSSGGSIVLRDRSGFPLGITNESGPKALARGADGSQWEVILPDGTIAYVRQSDVFVAAG